MAHTYRQYYYYFYYSQLHNTVNKPLSEKWQAPKYRRKQQYHVQAILY